MTDDIAAHLRVPAGPVDLTAIETDAAPGFDGGKSDGKAALTGMGAELADLQERLDTRKAVERAKSVLQQQLQLSEPDAFRWIQKTAMDLRLSMRQVADGVIAHGPSIAGNASS